MKYISLIILILFISSGCLDSKTEGSPTENDSIKSNINRNQIKTDGVINLYDITGMDLEIDPSISYFDMRSKISNIKHNIDTTNLSSDSISSIFSDIIINKIIPYWYGTKWSFDGYTSQPNDGVISCGYFVSTTLLHAGLNLNRYKLAQQSPILEAKSLALNSGIIEIFNNSISENISQLKDTLKNGIYFIGFEESHVGYLYKNNKDVYLIHSNFINQKGVEVESIETSEVFSFYNRLYIAELSTNLELIKKWIANTQVFIMTE